MKAAIYLRSSTDEQVSSPEIQRDKLQAWAKLKDFEIVNEYQDFGVSGKIPLNERPAGRQLLEDAKQKKFQVLLVYDISRFGRSALEILRAVESLKALNVKLLSHNESFDGTTPAGEMALTMFAAIAQFEKTQIARRTLDGQIRTVKQGKFLSGVIPFGFCLDPDNKLIPDPTTAPIAKEIFENLASGSTLMQEANRLNTLGVPVTRRYRTTETNKGKIWLHSRLSRMVNNTVYYGQFEYESKQSKQIIRYDVPAIITKELFLKVQDRLKQNKSLPRAKHHVNLLRGMIKCNLCGGTYIASAAYSYRKYANKRVYVGHYYRCINSISANRKYNRCPAKQIHAEKYETLTWNLFKHIILNPDEILAIANQRLKTRQKELESGLSKSKLQQSLQDCQTQRDKILGLLRKDKISDIECEHQLDLIQKDQLSLQQELQHLETIETKTDILSDQIKEAKRMFDIGQSVIYTVEHDKDREGMHKLLKNFIVEIVAHTTIPNKGRQKSLDLEVKCKLGHRTNLQELQGWEPALETSVKTSVPDVLTGC